MSAIQVAIRIKPPPPEPAVFIQGTAKRSFKSPFALDSEECALSLDSNIDRNPWIVANDTTLRYDGAALPEGVRPSAPLSFAFDSVYDATVSTQEIYEQSAAPLIEAALLGMNATIFAYGQTSSGKTFTMQGNVDQPGIIPLAMQDIFDMIQQSTDKEFLLRVSYLEIYNEVITDLLNAENTNLKIHETSERGIFVGGLTETVVSSWEQVYQLMKSGEEKRTIGKTNMNEYSSRSHTLFRMVLESRQKNTLSSASPASSANCTGRASLSGPVTLSTLNLVDLAGSERVGYTGAEGMRLKEGAHINKSLLALGTVISKLADLQSSSAAESISASSAHVPFRDSKLTRILQTALGGNSRTLIVCTMTASPFFFEESLSTLKFAARARMIHNKPIINTAPLSSEALLVKYRKEITELKAHLEAAKKIEESHEQQERQSQLQQKLQLFEAMILSSTNLKATNVCSIEPDDHRRKRRKTWFSVVSDPVALLEQEAADESEKTATDTSKFDALRLENEFLKSKVEDLEAKLIASKASNPQQSPANVSKIPNHPSEGEVKVHPLTRLSELEIAHKSLSAEFSELEAQHLRLLVKHEELGHLHDASQKNAKDLAAEKETLLSRCKMVIEQIDDIQSALSKKDEVIATLEEQILRMRDANLASQLEKLEKEIAENEATIVSLKLVGFQANEKLLAAHQEVDELNLQINEKSLAISELSKSLHTAKLQFKELEVEATDMASKTDEILIENQSLNDNIKLLGTYSKLLEQELDGLTNGELRMLLQQENLCNSLLI